MSDIFPRLDPQLLLTKKIEAPTVVNAIEAIKQELVLKLTQTGLGNRLQAEVLAKLPDGSFIAKIADLPVHVDLPRNPAIGQKISLTISQIIPHPVFALHESEQGTSLISPKTGAAKVEAVFHDYIRQLGLHQQHAQRLTQQATDLKAATGTAQAVPTSQTSASQASEALGFITATELETGSPLSTTIPLTDLASEPELSPAAKLISQVLKEQSSNQPTALIRTPQALISSQQIHASQHEMSQHIASTLQQQIQHSGLFYESHLVDWINGQRSLTELKLEPQTRLPQSPLSSTETLLQNLGTKEHEQLSQLVSQQLNLLEQQRLHYAGLLAPGMPFQWALEARDQTSSRAKQTPDDTEKIWSSTLKLTLPELGDISIAFTLNHNKLDLTLRGNKATTIEKLNARFAQLASMMQASGTDIVSYKSTYHESP